MALTKDVTLDSGIVLLNSYIKIKVMEDTVNTVMNITVDIYKDQAARNDGLQPAVQFLHTCNGSLYGNYFSMDVLNQADVNTVQQGYEWLKTLSFYTDAADVTNVKE